jgi:hypothetical protein
LYAGLDSLVKYFAGVGIDVVNPQHDKRGLVIESTLRLYASHVARAARCAVDEAQVFVMVTRSKRGKFVMREHVAAMEAAGCIG